VSRTKAEAENRVIDAKELSEGWTSGNYAAAYGGETCNPPSATTGFRQVGYVLGFYSAYTDEETPAGWLAVIERARKSPAMQRAAELGGVEL